MCKKFNKVLLTGVFLTSLSNLFASSLEGTELALYQQGLKLRDARQYNEAVSSFKSLANAGHEKAQHNLASCYHHLGDEQKSYDWFRKASLQGFQPSLNNLKRMNLLFLLLPDEIISQVASFLPLKTVMNFGQASVRTHHITSDLIRSTNFLTSNQPYAQNLRHTFRHVTFDPQPTAIKLLMSAQTKTGSVEVHFRDGQHLRSIVDGVSSIRTPDRIYFVHDETAKEGHELIATQGKVEKSHFIHIVANGPVNVIGELVLPCPLHLPTKSSFNQTTLRGSSISSGDLKLNSQINNLIEIIETFNEDVFRNTTQDAYSLHDRYQQMRIQHPIAFPDFETLNPHVHMVSDSNIEIIQKIYFESTKPYVYMAKSVKLLNELRQELPETSAIYYVNAHQDQTGIYCSELLSFKQGFEIFSNSDLIVAGRIYLPKYHLRIESKSSLCMVGARVYAEGSLTYRAGKDLYNQPLYNRWYENLRPQNISEQVWQRFIHHGFVQGLFH